MTCKTIALALPLLLGACAVKDSRIAENAQISLRNMTEANLESCIGVPDQHATFGKTDILTYNANSASSSGFTLPLVGGPSFSNGGYCHATFTLENGRVTRLLFSGEKNATLAPDAYCAPILRTCMDQLRQAPAQARS